MGGFDAGAEPGGRLRTGARRPHLSGEEVDAVAVEVAAGTVIVLGGPGVGVPREDLRVP